MDATYDVVVVGGGAAGLSGALALARSRRSVLVVDAGEPRNATAGHVHNYLGREGAPPAELTGTGRAEVVGYGGTVATGRVVSAERLDGAPGGFRLGLADGTRVRARRLLLTAGLVDELPDLEGLWERWGRDVLHCPYCHGWEVRDQAIGVLATSPLALHVVHMFRQLSADVTFLTHTAPAPAEDDRRQLAARGIAVLEGVVASVQVDDDRLTGVRLRSGEALALDALVVQSIATVGSELRDGLLRDLGVEVAELRMGDALVGTYVPGDPMGATAAPGVWVAGNLAEVRRTVLGSAASGLDAAAAINADLVAEDVRTAVAGVGATA